MSDPPEYTNRAAKTRLHAIRQRFHAGSKERKQIGSIGTFCQATRLFLQLFIRSPAIAPRDLRRHRDSDSTLTLQALHKGGSQQQRVMRAGIMPGVIAAKYPDLQTSPLQVTPIDIRD